MISLNFLFSPFSFLSKDEILSVRDLRKLHIFDNPEYNLSKPIPPMNPVNIGFVCNSSSLLVSLTLTFGDGYSSNSPRPIPKENTDAADVASKIVPEAAAADDTHGFAEEAKKVRYIFFDSFKPKAFVFSIARKSQLIFYFFYFFFFFSTCSLLNLIFTLVDIVTSKTNASDKRKSCCQKVFK